MIRHIDTENIGSNYQAWGIALLLHAALFWLLHIEPTMPPSATASTIQIELVSWPVSVKKPHVFPLVAEEIAEPTETSKVQTTNSRPLTVPPTNQTSTPPQPTHRPETVTPQESTKTQAAPPPKDSAAIRVKPLSTPIIAAKLRLHKRTNSSRQNKLTRKTVQPQAVREAVIDQAALLNSPPKAKKTTKNHVKSDILNTYQNISINRTNNVTTLQYRHPTTSIAKQSGFPGQSGFPRQLANIPEQLGGYTPPLSHAAHLSNPQPTYPANARRRGFQGTVLLSVEVDTTGLPIKVTIKRGSGHAILDRSALSTIKQWRFVPAQNAGVAIRAMVDVPIRFQLI